MDEDTNTYSSFEDMRKSYDSINNENEKENESLLEEINESPKIEEGDDTGGDDTGILVCVVVLIVGIVILLSIL